MYRHPMGHMIQNCTICPELTAFHVQIINLFQTSESINPSRHTLHLPSWITKTTCGNFSFYGDQFIEENFQVESRPHQQRTVNIILYFTIKKSPRQTHFRTSTKLKYPNQRYSRDYLVIVYCTFDIGVIEWCRNVLLMATIVVEFLHCFQAHKLVVMFQECV